MDTIRVIFIKHSLWNLPSTAIRLGLPHSLIHLGLSSHSLIVDGDYAIEAKMLFLDNGKIRTGIRRVLLSEALVGATIIKDVSFKVPYAEAGLIWARAQVGKPYDFKGAFALFLVPNRNWQEDNSWYCYELVAAAIHNSGRKLFNDLGHITGRELLGVNPE